MVQSHFEWRILRFPCGGYSEASMFRFHYYLHKKKCFEIYNQASQWNFIFQMIFSSPAMPQKLFKNLQLKQFEILLLAAELTIRPGK